MDKGIKANNNDEKLEKMFCNGEQLSSLLKNVSTARRELKNIRNDLKTLKYTHDQEINCILRTLKTWKCQSCSITTTMPEQEDTESENSSSSSMKNGEIKTSVIQLKPIGVVNTCFPEKRATPRQSSVCSVSRGKVTLFNSVFTNPNQSLEGLEEFSHMWILYHFHKNDSTHVRAKISPPRLNGLRIGVFGTRSPNRPSPIGLSLVRIDSIIGDTVYFSGVDMLDGSPVLDIKPYIPQYDNPLPGSFYRNESLCRLVDDENNYPADESREAPDGQDADTSDNNLLNAESVYPVRIAEWIKSASATERLHVVFNDQAMSQLQQIANDEMRTLDDDNNVTVQGARGAEGDMQEVISSILQEDPRSAYVRQRYSNQFYTFLIGTCHVSCKFDDTNRSVQVYRVARSSDDGNVQLEQEVTQLNNMVLHSPYSSPTTYNDHPVSY